jgi:hypothetical protein
METYAYCDVKRLSLRVKVNDIVLKRVPLDGSYYLGTDERTYLPTLHVWCKLLQLACEIDETRTLTLGRRERKWMMTGSAFV